MWNLVQKKLNLFLTACILFLILFVLIVSSNSTALEPIIRNAIITAYMNGFVDAVQTDNEEIKSLKKDKKRLKQTVETAALRYITTVENMNKSTF